MCVCAHVITNVFVHVCMTSTRVLCVCVCSSMFCVFVHVCLCVVCVSGVLRGGKRGARQFNTRCLKSVGLTACHKTAWLIESPGMSPPPKGLMKRALFAKTVPWFDLP